MVDLGSDDEEDVASAAPLPADQLPAPLANTVITKTVPFGPCRCAATAQINQPASSAVCHTFHMICCRTVADVTCAGLCWFAGCISC